MRAHIIPSETPSPARGRGVLGRGHARFSVRLDNRGRAGPETAAVFRGRSLIGFNQARETDNERGGTIHERRARMRGTKARAGTGET